MIGVVGISPSDLRAYVIVPVLDVLMVDPNEAPAVELLLGTSLQETGGGRYLAQLDQGPARGAWQMEPATHDDIWKNYLNFRPALAERVKSFCRNPSAAILPGNLYYACAMARIDYLRAPEPLPPAGDIEAQAVFYKCHFNSGRGKATVDEYLAHWRAAFPTPTQKDRA